MFCLSHPRRMTTADVNTVENSFIVATGETNGGFIALGIEGRGGRVKVQCCSKEMQCPFPNTLRGTHSALKQRLFCVHEFMSMPAFFCLFLSTQYPESQIERDSVVYFLMSYPVPI